VVELPKARGLVHDVDGGLLHLPPALERGGDASAEGGDFRDDFTVLDPARWLRGDHMLGRSYPDPANVDVDGENLRIKLPARTTDGARSPPGTSTVTAPTPPA
jgi:hypothetical protein